MNLWIEYYLSDATQSKKLKASKPVAFSDFALGHSRWGEALPEGTKDQLFLNLTGKASIDGQEIVGIYQSYGQSPWWDFFHFDPLQLDCCGKKVDPALEPALYLVCCNAVQEEPISPEQLKENLLKNARYRANRYWQNVRVYGIPRQCEDAWRSILERNLRGKELKKALYKTIRKDGPQKPFVPSESLSETAAAIDQLLEATDRYEAVYNNR